MRQQHSMIEDQLAQVKEENAQLKLCYDVMQHK